MIPLSPAVRSLKPSATIAAAAQAKALKARGVNVLDFTLGEPDFDTPLHIQEAAIQAIRSGKTHYTPSSGIPELRQAVCAAYARDHGLDFRPEQVIISNGAKHALHNVITALCGPGDEVIIPAPYWVSYSALVELAGAVPVIVPTLPSDRFCLQPIQLARAITPRTRLLMLNNPSNPTGMTYPPSLLRELAAVVLEHGLCVLSDEIYEKLVYEGAEFISFAALDPRLAERTVIVSGVSKAYAMTGWRIGWSISPRAIAAAIDGLQSQQTSNPCSISQHAAVAGLSGPQESVEAMRREFDQRRAYVVQRLHDLPGVSFVPPNGAFYAFFDVSAHFGRPLPGGEAAADATQFCAALLSQAHVALVSGDAFEAPGFVRLSFATGLPVLEQGFDRLAKFLRG
jgi:aspartate aminotransferase